MPLPLVLLFATADDPALMLKAAVDRIGARGVEATCADPSAPAARFRLDREAQGKATMKDRAFQTDGSYCNVVGARRCTSHGRTLFSTGLGD